MVKAVREAGETIGKVDYSLTDKMLKGREFSRSLYVEIDIKSCELINDQNVCSIRPGSGLHLMYYKEGLGKKVKMDLSRGTPLRLEDVK